MKKLLILGALLCVCNVRAFDFYINVNSMQAHDTIQFRDGPNLTFDSYGQVLAGQAVSGLRLDSNTPIHAIDLQTGAASLMFSGAEPVTFHSTYPATVGGNGTSTWIKTPFADNSPGWELRNATDDVESTWHLLKGVIITLGLFFILWLKLQQLEKKVRAMG